MTGNHGGRAKAARAWMIATYMDGASIVPPLGCVGTVVECRAGAVKIDWLPAPSKSKTTAGRLRQQRRERTRLRGKPKS